MLAAATLERRTKLLALVWPKAMSGDVAAIGVARRIVDAECRLLGLV